MSSKTKTTATKEEATPALVPKLRFPEFRDSDDWQTKLLGGLCKIRTGKKDANEGASDGQYPFFTCAENHIFSHSYSFDAEAILIAGNANVGQTRYYSGKFEAYQRTYVLTDFSGISVPYLYAVLNAKLRESLLAHVQVSAMSYIKLPMLQEYALAVPPSPAEQQKIAECLSSVDELMAAQARKVDALKTHKKGLMQQLFPREGETVPRLRFPEFRGEGEWEMRKLEEVTDSVFDGTHQTPTYTQQGVPFYSVENLISGNANKFISRDDYLLATKRNRPEKGDVLITRIGKIGFSQVVTWEHEFSVYVTLAVIKQSRAFNSHFLSYFMQSDFYQSELRSKSLPNAVPPKINLDSLRATEVLLTNEDEQKRIASCLTSLDDLIAAQTQKLDALKNHKKGLMQQLFPSSENQSTL